MIHASWALQFGFQMPGCPSTRCRMRGSSSRAASLPAAPLLRSLLRAGGSRRLRLPHPLATAQSCLQPHAATARQLPRCLTPAQRRGGGGRQLWAAAALHVHTWAGSTAGEMALNRSGLSLGAEGRPSSPKPFLLQLTPEG